MRAIYRLPRSKYPPTDAGGNPAPFGDVVFVNKAGRGQAILYAARNPHEGLESLGASLIGNGWVEAKGQMTQSQADESFDAEWDDVDEDGNAFKARGRRKGIPSGKTPTVAYAVPAAFHHRDGDEEQAALDASA